jgi:pilus assembly protein Flp/PilA
LINLTSGKRGNCLFAWSIVGNAVLQAALPFAAFPTAAMRAKPMSDFYSHFLRDENGATAIEYTIMAAGIALVIIVAVNAVGSAVNQKFVDIKSVIP